MATTKFAIAPMKAAQVPKPGGDFEIVEREIPKPADGQVRIKVQACGICHSDAVTKDGMFPSGFSTPASPDMKLWALSMSWAPVSPNGSRGQRVGIGWHGGHDGVCLYCRRGDFRNCKNVKIPGISYDGGYQQYMVAPVTALASIPESLDSIEAAPLLCAGITTYNSLRHAGALSRRSCRGAGNRRPWTPRHSVRAQVRLQSRGHRTRSRQCVSRRETS